METISRARHDQNSPGRRSQAREMLAGGLLSPESINADYLLRRPSHPHRNLSLLMLRRYLGSREGEATRLQVAGNRHLPEPSFNRRIQCFSVEAAWSRCGARRLSEFRTDAVVGEGDGGVLVSRFRFCRWGLRDCFQAGVIRPFSFHCGCLTYSQPYSQTLIHFVKTSPSRFR